MAGENAPPDQATALHHEYCLFTKRPVSEDLLNRPPATIELAIYAMIVAVAGGKRNAASLDKRTATRCETPMN
jgi:hypothetical protein